MIKNNEGIFVAENFIKKKKINGKFSPLLRKTGKIKFFWEKQWRDVEPGEKMSYIHISEKYYLVMEKDGSVYIEFNTVIFDFYPEKIKAQIRLLIYYIYRINQSYKSKHQIILIPKPILKKIR